MPHTRRTYLIAFLAALAVGFLARLLYYYPGPLRIPPGTFQGGFYRAPQVAESTPASIESLSGVSETGLIEGGENRVVLIDAAHDNRFSLDELAAFSGSLASNGAQIVFVEQPEDLTGALPQADALIVIAPSDPFETDEIRAISQFVQKGGRLILIGEPTRQDSIDALNSLAGGFGVIYQDAYIYNLSANDSGFRNVVFTEFGDTPITEGVSEIVFQTAYALRADPASAVIMGDDETYTSRDETPGGVIAATLTENGRVLALPDLTFFTSPYNTFADNEVLLGNIAAFALSGERGFDLADFPFFFTQTTDVIYQNPVTLNETFEDSVALRTRLAEAGTQASLSEEAGEENPYIYVSLYEDASGDMLNLLEADGITISDEPLSNERGAPDSEGSIAIEGVARLEKGDTVFIHLLRPSADGDGDARYRLVILAASEESLSDGVDRLIKGDLEACLVTPQTAVCHNGDVETAEGDDEEEEEEAETGEDQPTASPDGAASFLVVSDDQALMGPVGETSAEAVAEALEGADHRAVVYEISAEDVPDVDTLQEYDAVFWLTGDYCCSSPSSDSVEVLTAYVAEGGRLFMAGMFIATDWKDDPFLNDTLGAEFLKFGPQVDMEPADDPHPLSEGFEGVTKFSDAQGPIQPDVIEPVGDATAVFVRGPDSSDPGEAALVAYEADEARVAFAAFPLFALEEDDLARLMENAASWLIGTE